MSNIDRRTVLFSAAATAAVASSPSVVLAGSFDETVSTPVVTKHVPGTHDVEPDWFEVLGVDG